MKNNCNWSESFQDVLYMHDHPWPSNRNATAWCQAKKWTDDAGHHYAIQLNKQFPLKK